VALMSLLSPRARVVVDPCVYGCTYSLLQKLAKWGIELVPVETTDTEAVAEALEPGADLVFLETPMNPTLRVVDLEATADLAHEAGARLVVDNTFATPIAQRPLELGADLVVHSLTKAIAGHSDLLGGAVAGSQELLEDVRLWRKDAGPVLDPETAWLALRGAQTLELRVRQMTRSAGHIARHLEGLGHEVRHPLLASHPDHTVAKRQMPLGTSVFTLDLGSAKAAMTFLDRLKHESSAVSLGGEESQACPPASTTHAPLGEAGQAAAAISEGLVRVSVGIEPTEVLIEDIEQALSGLAKPQAARIQA
ncbi:MAG: aminotransferase class I/II-fold pyridoxal phosphate-dependent enzyme, partial [Candidatus Thermoplasmatota archaeon]|nr:aminotransferase class I/II-fold pyridoxal phosphate-dependent enzyme [Candidatus Thermoplasmatota archaeon]